MSILKFKQTLEKEKQDFIDFHMVHSMDLWSKDYGIFWPKYFMDIHYNIINNISWSEIENGLMTRELIF